MTQAIRSSANVTSGYNVKSEQSLGNEPANLGGNYRAGMIAGFLMLALTLGLLYSSKHQKSVVTHSIQPVLSVPATPPIVTSVVVPPAPVTKHRVRRVASTVNYVNPDYGISFRYARKYELVSGEAMQSTEDNISPVHMNFSEPGGEALASVQLPARSYAGTDFQSAMFNVSVNNHLTLDKCAQFASSDKELSEGGAVSTSETKVGAMHLEGTTDKGLGDSKYYHVFNNGTCYEFELALATVAGESSAGLKPVNHEEVFGKLDKILSSVVIQSPKADSGE
ncbi:MAG TPA: hypothetical protein VFA74_18830 [Terriglobales bacterium]|nr:hypothetical protein [Terriglobales bacterium]